MGKPKGESRGLGFLTEARPEAIQHLLKFFGESGRHLEPKTRFLISVVTKVISNSPRGLQQYVKRALGEGASADEVLDAVLCAYPCAGLTKVVDAVDVILGMELPEFDALVDGATEDDSGGEGAEGDWHPLVDLEDLPVGASVRVVTGSHDLAVFRTADAVYAVDNVCPHKGGFLSQGPVIGDVVTCPLHGWKFQLGSGQCTHRPGTKVRSYPVRVTPDSAKIEVALP